jgi:hypothetical protein
MPMWHSDTRVTLQCFAEQRLRFFAVAWGSSDPATSSHGIDMSPYVQGGWGMIRPCCIAS